MALLFFLAPTFVRMHYVKLKWLTGLVFLLPLFVRAQTNCGPTESKKAGKLFEKGINRKVYDTEERIEFLRKSVEEDPEFAQAWYALGQCLVTKSKAMGTGVEPSRKAFEHAISLCPDNFAYAYFYLGKLLWLSGDYKNSAIQLKRFIDLSEEEKKEEDIEWATEYANKSSVLDDLRSKPVPFSPSPISGISSSEDEFLPSLSPDNECMFYTHRYMKQSKNELVPKQTEELTQAFQSGQDYVRPTPLDKPFNVPGEGFGGATLSLDKKEMIVTICKTGKNGKVNCDLFSTKLVEGKWGPFQNLGEAVNTADGWESQPSLSGDGKTLFFAGARADSKGGMDIYRTHRQSDGGWGPAENLGAPVNTKGNEKSPFIHPDSQTLYFASDGQAGLGGYDLFLSKQSLSGIFAKPTNLGYPINTEQDEVAFSVSLDGKRGFFSSNLLKGKGSGGWDIYSFPLYADAQPEKVVFLRGQIDLPKGLPAKGTKLKIQGLDPLRASEIEVDSLSGSYVGLHTLSKSETSLTITLQSDDLAFSSQRIEVKPDDPVEAKAVAIKAQKLEEGKSFPIPDLQYSTNASELDPLSVPILESFVEYLLEHPSLKVEIRGHTDNKGDPAANLALSTDRAFTVYDFLMKKGVQKERLSFRGYGDAKPIDSNSTEAGRLRNRRTEFYVVKP